MSDLTDEHHNLTPDFATAIRWGPLPAIWEQLKIAGSA